MKWLKNLLTKDDNQTFDEIKVAVFIAIVSASTALWHASLLCVYLVVLKGQENFDANAFMSGIGSFLTGCGALVGAGGIGLGARDKLSQPPKGDDNAP